VTVPRLWPLTLAGAMVAGAWAGRASAPVAAAAPAECPDERPALARVVDECERAQGPGQFSFSVTALGDGVWHADCEPRRERLPAGPNLRVKVARAAVGSGRTP
jgi:hypothetical protein